MDGEVLSIFSDEDRELFIRMDILQILTQMNSAFSYLTRMQESMPYLVNRAQRQCGREAGTWSKIFQAASRHQARVELGFYPASYAVLARELADLNIRVVDSKPGTDYTGFISEMEEKVIAIGQHIDYVRNRLAIVSGTEKKRKFTLD